jgi:hypothetical protein
VCLVISGYGFQGGRDGRFLARLSKHNVIVFHNDTYMNNIFLPQIKNARITRLAEVKLNGSHHFACEEASRNGCNHSTCIPFEGKA